MTPTATVKRVARDLGFDDCRIAAAREANHADEFHRWIADGHHGDMEWLARNPQRRCDPREVLPGCQSVVCLALIGLLSRISVTRILRTPRFTWGFATALPLIPLLFGAARAPHRAIPPYFSMRTVVYPFALFFAAPHD